MAYMAYMLLSGGEDSRPVFLMFFTATAWMLSIYLMDLYPWNIVVDTHGLTPVALEIPNPDQNPNSNWILPVSTFS